MQTTKALFLLLIASSFSSVFAADQSANSSEPTNLESIFNEQVDNIDNASISLEEQKKVDVSVGKNEDGTWTFSFDSDNKYAYAAGSVIIAAAVGVLAWYFKVKPSSLPNPAGNE